MIVIDTSVFIDALFEYNPDRTKLAKVFFRELQRNNVSVMEPDVFKIELIGQLVRRMPKSEAMELYEEITRQVEIIETSNLHEVLFEVALRTGCRAIDSFYIVVAHLRKVPLVSNDKFQVKSARKYGVKAFYLLKEFEDVKLYLLSRFRRHNL